MKKVILEKQEQQVTALSEVSSYKYYGLIDTENVKGFISSKTLDGRPFVLCAEHLTRGNGWLFLDNRKTLASCIKNAIEKNFDVFEFNTHKELFEWLAK